MIFRAALWRLHARREWRQRLEWWGYGPDVAESEVWGLLRMCAAGCCCLAAAAWLLLPRAAAPTAAGAASVAAAVAGEAAGEDMVAEGRDAQQGTRRRPGAAAAESVDNLD
jgi:hypothetical protein